MSFRVVNFSVDMSVCISNRWTTFVVELKICHYFIIYSLMEVLKLVSHVECGSKFKSVVYWDTFVLVQWAWVWIYTLNDFDPETVPRRYNWCVHTIFTRLWKLNCIVSLTHFLFYLLLFAIWCIPDVFR